MQFKGAHRFKIQHTDKKLSTCNIRITQCTALTVKFADKITHNMQYQKKVCLRLIYPFAPGCMENLFYWCNEEEIL